MLLRERAKQEDTMSVVGNIYDTEPIAPIAQIEENLTIWTEQKWKWFKVNFIEPIPRSTPYVFNFCTAAAPVIAANTTVQRQVLAILQMQQDELFHIRFCPIDDVECRIFELAAAARFSTRGGHARVSLFTQLFDPYLASTTFFVIGGENKDAQVECINTQPVAIGAARVAFWGYRYLVEELKSKPSASRYLPAQAML